MSKLTRRLHAVQRVKDDVFNPFFLFGLLGVLQAGKFQDVPQFDANKFRRRNGSLACE